MENEFAIPGELTKHDAFCHLTFAQYNTLFKNGAFCARKSNAFKSHAMIYEIFRSKKLNRWHEQILTFN